MNQIFQACENEALKVVLTNEERQPCEVWTRVMGYHRPVASFNIGKKGEHNERKFFCESHAQIEADSAK